VTFTVVVPGKLMLAGEYSVLGPAGEALAVAVGPGLAVEAVPASRWTLSREDSTDIWTDQAGTPPESLSFAHAALQRALRHSDAPPHRLTTRALVDTGSGDRKPGVGGSASVVVAVVAAVLEAAGGVVDPATVLPLALDAHAAGQGGRGSGYDVATICHGGLVQWRPSLLAGGAVVAGEARSLRWPDELHLVAGYTGRSANTRSFLKAMEAHAERDRIGAVRALAALGRPVGTLVDRFAGGGSPAEIAQALSACHDAFVRWDAEVGIGAVTPEIEQMVRLAAQVGASAKVSGAGGGDSVIALADSAEQVVAIRETWRASGFIPLPVEISCEGVRIVKAKKTQRKGSETA
jgi:phosphomevalonate kinase